LLRLCCRCRRVCRLLHHKLRLSLGLQVCFLCRQLLLQRSQHPAQRWVTWRQDDVDWSIQMPSCAVQSGSSFLNGGCPPCLLVACPINSQLIPPYDTKICQTASKVYLLQSLSPTCSLRLPARHFCWHRPLGVRAKHARLPLNTSPCEQSAGPAALPPSHYTRHPPATHKGHRYQLAIAKRVTSGISIRHSRIIKPQTCRSSHRACHTLTRNPRECDISTRTAAPAASTLHLGAGNQRAAGGAVSHQARGQQRRRAV
jgi:hypothetical protein